MVQILSRQLGEMCGQIWANTIGRIELGLLSGRRALTRGMLASHGRTNVQSVVQACGEGRLAAEPALTINNNRDSAVLEIRTFARHPPRVGRRRRVSGPSTARPSRASSLRGECFCSQRFAVYLYRFAYVRNAMKERADF